MSQAHQLFVFNITVVIKAAVKRKIKQPQRLQKWKNWRATLFLLLPMLIAACGGESSSGSDDVKPAPQPNGSVVINAMDSTSSVREGTVGLVDLMNNVKTSDGSQAYLSQVIPIGNSISDQCRHVKIDTNNLAFSVTANEIGACTYQYQVRDLNNQVTSRAISRVAVQSSDGPTAVTYTLPPLSQTMAESETVDIVLPTALGGAFPNGGVLDTSLTVLGSGSAIADPATNTISYTASNESSVTRVLYTIIAGDDVYLGTIDIAVSTSINTAPLAQSFTYQDPQCMADNTANGSDNRCDQITHSDNIVIDLADKIGDPDEGDTAQVIDVYSFDADVSLTNPSDPTSSKITFSTTMPKAYYISYVVSDHRGGYAIGQIEIMVVGEFPYIIVDETGDVFAPPPTTSQADYLGLNVLGVYTEHEPNGPEGMVMPTFDWETANAICVSKGGSLPTISQMAAFYHQEGYNFYTHGGWPSSFRYWTSTSNEIGSMLAWDNRTTFFEAVDPSEGAYVTCIDKTPSSISIVNPGVIPLNIPVQLSVNYQTASGVVSPYTKPLEWQTSNPAIASINQETGEVTGLVKDKTVDITASSFDGGLADTANMEVVENMILVAGADPGFESFAKSDGSSCEATLFPDDYPNNVDLSGTGWYMSGNTVSKVYLYSNCPEQTPFGSKVYLRGGTDGVGGGPTITHYGKFPFYTGNDFVTEFDMRLTQFSEDMSTIVRITCDNGIVQYKIWDRISYSPEIWGFLPNVVEPYIPSVNDKPYTGQDIQQGQWVHYLLPLNMSSIDNGSTQQCSFSVTVSNIYGSHSNETMDVDNLLVYPTTRLSGD